MRIAYILTSLATGGAERQVLALAQRMQVHGHSVLIVVLRPQCTSQCPTHLDVMHLDLFKNPVSAVRAYRRALEILQAFRPHIVHSHNFHGNLLARLLKLAIPSLPVLSTMHNTYEGGRMRMLTYRLTDPLSIGSVAVCNAIADRYVAESVIPLRKCRVIPNGIDASEFAPDAERRAELRAKLSAVDRFIWLAAGRVTPAKDYPNLLRAFAQVRAHAPHAELWIAGEGQGSYMAYVQAISAELGTHTSVRWLGLQRDMPALLDAADGFALSSAWEGMPLVIGEAMAMQKTIVATDVGGVREMVGDCGMLVNAGDSPALAQAMIAVMQSPVALREQRGREARFRILQEFDANANADLWARLYEECIASNPRDT